MFPCAFGNFRDLVVIRLGGVRLKVWKISGNMRGTQPFYALFMLHSHTSLREAGQENFPSPYKVSLCKGQIWKLHYSNNCRFTVLMKDI